MPTDPVNGSAAIRYPSRSSDRSDKGPHERFQKAEQSLGAVQRDDVATVLDEVADEVVGEWS